MRRWCGRWWRGGWCIAGSRAGKRVLSRSTIGSVLISKGKDALLAKEARSGAPHCLRFSNPTTLRPSVDYFAGPGESNPKTATPLAVAT